MSSLNKSESLDFGLIGAAGYVAPRHMLAIAEVGGRLSVALDPSDSVGVLDRYSPECEFFTSMERFERHLERLRYQGNPLDYLTVCSPNFLHDAHARMGLRSGADVICEKPLVLNPRNLDLLEKVEKDTGKRVFTILQLRHHQDVVQLAEFIQRSGRTDHRVDLSYVTPRGPWYDRSWKGDAEKSGGIPANIGIHFFDLIIDIFGRADLTELSRVGDRSMSGVLRCEKAEVQWHLSIDGTHLERGEANRRRLVVDGHNVDLSSGFENLHTVSYRKIIEGKGFGIQDARPAIELIERIRNIAEGTSA